MTTFALVLLIFISSTNIIKTASGFHPTFLHRTMTNHPNALRDGGHNHPTSTVKASRDHDLRDGSHNHPVQTMEAIEARLAAENLSLPKPGAAKANYQLIHRDGDLLYLSGHLPFRPDGSLVVGACAPSHVIEENESMKYLSTEEGYEAAKVRR